MKLESNSRKWCFTYGNCVHISHTAPHGCTGQAASSPALLQGLESEPWELEGILQHLVHLLTLLQEAGLLVLHLEPFKMLSGSASEGRNPTTFCLCPVWAVLFQRSGDRLLPVLALKAEGGLSCLWDGHLNDGLPHGTERRVQSPECLVARNRECPTKAPSVLLLLLHLQPQTTVDSSCLRLSGFRKHIHTLYLSPAG